MPQTTRSILSADLVSDEPELTIDDVCAACGLTREEIAGYVSEGLAPAQGPAVQWRFSRLTLIRLRRARRLERDLGLNPAGVALALDLMAQIERLQRRLARYEQEI
jgi:chaperone modulatory protein CbpM